MNLPEPVQVQSASGWPIVVHLRDASDHEVVSVEDMWRVEEEWWRGTPIVRTYFEVLLDDGRRITIFLDHTASCWYAQKYG